MLMKLRRRQTRHWAPTAGGVERLGRSARRLAENGQAVCQRPRVARQLAQLRKLLTHEQACRLRQADVLVALVGIHGLRSIDVAREVALRPCEVCNMVTTARAFPPGTRPPGVPYNHFYLAARMTRKFPTLGLSAAAALAELRRAGLTQHRDIASHFATLARAKSTSRAWRRSEPPAGMIYGRFQQHLHHFTDGSIKLLVVDPPYAFPRRPHGGYGGRAARPTHGDDADGGKAVQTVVDVLSAWQPKLAAGGALVLFQPTQMMPLELLRAFYDNGWEYQRLTWDKGRPQPGHLGSAFSTQTEDIYVCHRPGETPRNHDDSVRSNLLSFPPVSRPGRRDAQVHHYEKPIELMRFLVSKLTFAGERVVELCGCTAPATAAAIELGRSWAYVESNKDNFELGRARIGQVLASQARIA